MAATPRRLVVAVLFAVLAVITFSYTLTAPLDHNEHAYLTIGALLENGALYRDFFWPQMPYSAALYHAVYRAVGPGHYMLAGRLTNWCFGIASAFILYRLARRVGMNAWMSLGVAALLLANPVMMTPMKEASNYMLPMFFSLAGLWAFMTSMRRSRPSTIGLTGAGALFAAAAGARLYYVALLPPLAVATFLHPGGAGAGERFRRRFAPFLLGVAVGFAPASVPILGNLHAFWLSNIRFHQISHYHYYPEGISLFDKALYVRRMLGLHANVAFFVCFFLACALLVARWRRGAEARGERGRFEAGLTAALVLFSGAGAVVPVLPWIQHFAFPLPFVLLLFVYVYDSLNESGRRAVRMAFIPVLLVAFFFHGAWLLAAVGKLPQTETWTPSKVSRAAAEIRGRIGPMHGSAKVATLSPLYAIEAGLTTYPAFSSGCFLYRTARFFSEEARAALDAPTPDTLGAMLDADPPAAILTGEEGALDNAFVEYAQRRGYRRIRLETTDLGLFVKKR